MKKDNRNFISIASLFIVIIGIIILGFFIFRLYKDNKELNEKILKISEENIKLNENNIDKDIYAGKEEKNNNNNNQLIIEENQEPIKEEIKQYKPLYISKENMINQNKNEKYRFKGLNDIIIEEVKQKYVKLSYTSRTFNSNDIPYKELETTITTSKNVQEVYVGEIGQGISSTVLLFLLEDGTVEYLNIYNAIKNTNDFKVKKIPEIKDVIKFYTMDAYDETTGWMTVLAQRYDGKIYDINDYIKD